MAFYEEFGRKISKTGQGVVQKTKDIAEIAKLNTSINELERGISTAYTEIGKIYYKKYAMNPEDMDMVEYINKITESAKTVEMYRTQICMIKGGIQCPSCGGYVNEGAVFCSQCGTRIIVSVPDNNQMLCPRCGERVNEGQTFCMYCGLKLDLKNELKTKDKCIFCGAEMDEDDIFCSNCGKRKEGDIYLKAENSFLSGEISELKDAVQESLSQEIPGEKFCVECGTELSADDVFCSNCGTKR